MSVSTESGLFEVAITWMAQYRFAVRDLSACSTIRLDQANAPIVVLAKTMGQWDVPYRQGVLDAIELLRGQWTVAVLATLALGETKYKDLREAINDVEERTGWTWHDRPLSDRVLTDTLRRVRQNKLVERRAEPGRFGSVWYQLTPTGRSLLRASRPLAEWSQTHRRQTLD